MAPEKAGVIRVLHVDDDTSILEVSKQILMLQGNFEIDQANCVDDALHKLAVGQYDAIVSDYEMPHKNGLEFLEELRKQNKEIPFVLFTGKGREEVAIKALNLGADGYVNKQGNSETIYGELSHTIRIAVENSKAKKELEERDIRLWKLASQTPGMLYQFMRLPNGTYCIPFTSDAIRKIFGCSPQEVREDFSPITRVIIPEDLEKVIRSIDYSATHLTPWQCEYRVKLPGQQIRWLWGQSIPEKLSDGSIIWNGYNADITDHKKSEDELRLANKRLELAQHAANAGMWDWDIITGEIKWTAKMFELFGLNPQTTVASFAAWTSILHPEDKDKAKTNIDTALKNHAFLDNEYRIVRPDGKILWINSLGKAEYDNQGNPLMMSGLCIDITQRKNNEELIKESLAKYRDFAESLPEIVFEIDAKGNLIFVNQRASQIMGYDKEEFGTNFNFLRLVSPGEREKAAKNIKLLMNGENLGSNEYNLVKKDGTVFPVIVWANPRFVHNKVAGLRGIVVDISDHKKAEEKLQESQYLTQKILDSTPNLIYIYDLIEHKNVYANREVLDFLGYSPELIKAMGSELFNNILHPQDAQIVAMHHARFTNAPENALYEVEYRMKHSSGEWRWLHSRDVLFARTDDGIGKRILGSCEDITDRKKAQEAVKQSEERYRNLADSLPEIVFEADNNGKVIYANESAFKITGYTKEDFAKGLCIFDFLEQKDIPRAQDGLRKALTSERTNNDEFTFVRKDGGTFPIIIETNPIVEENRIVGLRGIVVDITQRKKAEDEVKKDQAKLEIVNEKLHVVGGLTRHDVGNKLLVIKSNVYLMKKQIGDNPTIVKHLEAIESALNSSERLFEFSRIYEKIGAEKPTKIDIADCFKQTGALFPSSDNIKILNNCQGLEVIADSLLGKLFYNLIDNSLKHGEKVTQIKLHYKKEVNQIKLIYEDNGVGVSEGDKSKLFLEGFTTGNGSGLGLLLIKKLIEVYGWKITETGEPGKGVKFIISIQKTNKNGQTNYQIQP